MSMINAKILIVDDDVDITLTLKFGLQEYGFIVDTFNDPLLALSKFKRDVYHLVLIDIRMPKMNGFELYREIHKIDRKVKVCFITSFVIYYESLREIFPNAKISCFIKKPVEIYKLAQKIRLELGENHDTVIK